MGKNQHQETQHNQEYVEHHQEILSDIINILNHIQLSEPQSAKLESIKQYLKPELDSEALLDHLVSVFHIVIDDLRTERKVAKSFLSTLSASLATVQQALNATVGETSDYQAEHQQLNENIAFQFNQLNEAVASATSLKELKQEVNNKLASITQAITTKRTLETEQFQALTQQMGLLKEKVTSLEQQSQQFERRIAEQKQKKLNRCAD